MSLDELVWDVSAWDKSPDVRMFTARQCGWYFNLLMECCKADMECHLLNREDFLKHVAKAVSPEIEWIGFDLPDKLMRVLQRRFDEEWKAVLAKFRTDNIGIYNERLLKEYQKRGQRVMKAQLAGIASGESKAGNKGATDWKLCSALALEAHSAFGRPPLMPSRTVIDAAKELLSVGRTADEIRRLVLWARTSKSQFRPNSPQTLLDPDKWEQWQSSMKKEHESAEQSKGETHSDRRLMMQLKEMHR